MKQSFKLCQSSCNDKGLLRLSIIAAFCLAEREQIQPPSAMEEFYECCNKRRKEIFDKS